jgi:hypothetical protein
LNSIFLVNVSRSKSEKKSVATKKKAVMEYFNTAYWYLTESKNATARLKRRRYFRH